MIPGIARRPCSSSSLTLILLFFLTVPSIIIGSFRKAKFNNFRELLRLSSLTMFSNSNFKDKVLHAMHVGH
ncbi:hypothetical protein V6N13_087226 [Hibiscus sabdariffa]|uniref:Uncharacterized protein n=1 Tax=Hibiscus sabdariffa TaxID=183260 RepID=A0ABR2FVJ7_9ROSI